MGGFVDEARRKVEEAVKLPAGRYRIEWGGQFESLERARSRLWFIVPVALGLIFVLLYATYNRVLDAARVFTGVPFAAVGGVLALWLRDMPFSISAAVGFIALSGVSVLGDMVLVSRVRQLLDLGLPIGEAVEQAAMTRLRPVIVTALVASFGSLPMALSTGVGAEVQRPPGDGRDRGGAISSTRLTLLVLPVLYTLTGGGPKGPAAGLEVPPQPASDGTARGSARFFALFLGQIA
jgi:cobalt-zinc-cadmium resistance protein CzcA